MGRKAPEGQFLLNFEEPQKGVLPKVTPEQIEASQLRVFYNYLKNLNLTEKDLEGKDILDVGASLGSFGDIAERFGARVVSMDEARPNNAQDVIEGNSKKLFNLPAEDMQLAIRLNLPEEPKFDLVISHFSTPYVFVNNEQDARGRWKSKKSPLDWRLEITVRTHTSLENIFKHLKSGGRAVLYPLFLNLDMDEQSAVDFGNGEKRDVREFNAIMHEVLRDLYVQYGEEFDVRIEPVPEKNGSDYTRLNIYRKNVK